MAKDSTTFLQKASARPAKLQPVYVLAGDEDFLKSQVFAVLKGWVLQGGDEAFGLSSYPGDKVEFATINDELATVPFLGSSRLVRVEQADPFVTKYRQALEKYVTSPAAKGILVLEVKSWPANTKLYKMVPADGVIECKAPAAFRVAAWCVDWAADHHGKKLSQPAAQLLATLIGPELGQLDQELTKLSIYVGDAKQIDVADVDVLVGRSQGANTFKIFDAIGAGKPGEALAILNRLCDEGEEPIRMLGAFSLQLRRLAQAGRLSQQGVPLGSALQKVGVPPFAIREAEQQLRHLGARRANLLYDWLLEADLGLKGSSQLPPRTLLERLIVRLGRPREN